MLILLSNCNQPCARSVWLLFIAISAHKYVISFCISLQFVTSGLKPLLSIIYFSTFALISPVGAGIGIALSGRTAATAQYCHPIHRPLDQLTDHSGGGRQLTASRDGAVRGGDTDCGGDGPAGARHRHATLCRLLRGHREGAAEGY